MNEVENYQVCAAGYGALQTGEFNLGVFPGLLKKIITNRMWEKRRLPNGKLVELNNLAELITAKPMDGWGENPDNVESLIRKDAEALTMFREAMKYQGERTDLINFHNNIMEVKQGTSRGYTLSRLKRETPELYNEVCEGKLSANAAAIKAGFRKKLTPFETVVKLLAKLTADEKQRLRDLL